VFIGWGGFPKFTGLVLDDSTVALVRFFVFAFPYTGRRFEKFKREIFRVVGLEHRVVSGIKHPCLAEEISCGLVVAAAVCFHLVPVAGEYQLRRGGQFSKSALPGIHPAALFSGGIFSGIDIAGGGDGLSATASVGVIVVAGWHQSAAHRARIGGLAVDANHGGETGLAGRGTRRRLQNDMAGGKTLFAGNDDRIGYAGGSLRRFGGVVAAQEFFRVIAVGTQRTILFDFIPAVGNCGKLVRQA